MRTCFFILSIIVSCLFSPHIYGQAPTIISANTEQAVRHDLSAELRDIVGPTSHKATSAHSSKEEKETRRSKRTSSSIEQTSHGHHAPAILVESFDGLGVGFSGPQGTVNLRNPSDNSLAVGPDHIVQTVNSVMAIFSRKGKRYDSTGKVLYGPVPTNNVFRGFGGACEKINNGDAVVRYDQLADRWLIVMPTFRKAALRNDSNTLKLLQPGKAVPLYQPSYTEPDTSRLRQARQRDTTGSYCMCYAISTGPDPFGSYYRYEFKRDLFPDYPRPAVWPDGYYTSTSTGDHVTERHAYVVDREKMLKGADATEQSFIIKDVNFLINADLDGKQLPPVGAPNIMMTTGGNQLGKVTEDDGIYVWKYYVDWRDPSKTRLEGPAKIPVAPYRYLCDGQLTRCVPQPGTGQRLDAQGDKLMARLVYRRIGNQQSMVGVHSVNSTAGGGAVRWYEFRINKMGDPELFQQGSYAPDGNYRWMASAAMDRYGNIGIGYSYGGEGIFAGQRFAARFAKDPPGLLTLKETVLVEGQASQTNTLRWQDYTQTAMDPGDDATIWYVGDYLKKGAQTYSTRIGAFIIGTPKQKKK